jgi:hypothetical protein
VTAPNAATTAAWGDKPPEASVRASDLKMIGENTLGATIDLIIPKWHLVIRGAPWSQKGGHEWVAVPATEWSDRNGTPEFSNILEFTDRETAGRFQGAVLAAVHAIAGTSWRRSIA